MKRSSKRRGPYKPACNNCTRRKRRCDGEPGSVCTTCQASGQSTMCNWDSYYARRNRSENINTDPPQRIEALHKLLIEYHGYSYKLEALLDRYAQLSLLPQAKDFRLDRPKDPDDLLGLSMTLGEFQEDNTMQYHDSESPTNILSWHDLSPLVEHCGISSPFRFRSDPLPLPPQFPAIAEDPELTYVLMVGPVTDTNYNPHFNWSRYLPSAVALDRGSHDNALNDLFRYCTSFCLRLIPDLFLKDMCRVLSVPRSQEPKTAHYSPMLHNSIVALALAFSDDPRFRDLKARQYFIDAAKSYMEAECQKPTLAVVQALSFLGTFYGSQGNQALGFMYFGLSARMAQVLGLNVDCSDYVQQKLMDPFDVIDRNWTAWSIFTSDVCWSLYVGREFATTVPDDDFPLPYIDTALDDILVVYGNLAPQPNYTTKTFHANAELFVLGRDILEVNNSLSKAKARPIEVFERIDYVDTKLNEWFASLPPELHLTTKDRSTATPHKLLLHLSYWWLFVLLHRPLFHYRTSMKAGRQIDHIKLCERAADGIMENLKSWQDLYGLRFCPVTLIQIAFSAGTVYLLLAVKACSGTRVAKKQLGHAIAQQKLVCEYLLEIGRSWPGANMIVEILKDLVQKKLTPLLDKIPVRNNDNQVTTPGIEEDEYPASVVPRSHQDHRRDQSVQTSSKNKREKPLKWRGGLASQPPQQPPFSHTSPTMSLTADSPPKHSATIPNPTFMTSQPHSNVSDFVTVGSPKTPNAKTSSTSSSPKAATTIRASTPHDHSTFQPVYPPSGNPPQPLPFSLTESMEGYAGQSDFHASQIQPSSYPDTGFSGMLQGQTVPQAPFWNHINMEEQNVSLLASLDEFINPSSFIPPTTDRPTDYLNFNVMDTDVSMAEHDDWCQAIFEIAGIEEDECSASVVPRSPSQDRGRDQPVQTSSKNKREKPLQWHGGPASHPPQQPPFSHTSPTMSLTADSPPKHSTTIPNPTFMTSQPHSNVSDFVTVGSPKTPDAKTSSTSSGSKAATTIRASTPHDHSTFQPVYPPSENPPQPLPVPPTQSMEGYASQSDFHASQIQPSSYPDTGFLGMPQGQTLPQAPFWNPFDSQRNSSNLNHVRALEEENPQGGLESGKDPHKSRSISRPAAVMSSSARLSAPVDVMNHLAETKGDIEALLHDVGINRNDVAFAASFDEEILESSGMLIQQAYILTRVDLAGDEGQLTRTLEAVGKILAPYSGVVSTPLRRYYSPTYLPSSGRCTFSEFISFHAKPMGVSLELLTRKQPAGIHHASDIPARTSTGSENRMEGVQWGDQEQDEDRSGIQREAERDSRPPNDSASGGNDGDAEGSHRLQSMETDKVESTLMSSSHHVASSFPPDDDPSKTSDAPRNAVHFGVEFDIRHSDEKCMPHQTIRVEGTVQSEKIPEASLPFVIPHSILSSRICFPRLNFIGNAGGTCLNEPYKQSSASVRINVGKDQEFLLFDVEPQSTLRRDTKVKQVETNERTRQHQVDVSTNVTTLPWPNITFGGKYGNTTAWKSGTTEESLVNINRIIQAHSARDASWHYSIDDEWVRHAGLCLRGLAPSACLSFVETEKGHQKPDKLKIEVKSIWTMPNTGVFDRYSRFVRNIPIRTLATQVTFDIPPHMTSSWIVCRKIDARIIPRDRGFGLKVEIESKGDEAEAKSFQAVISQVMEHYGDP